jgi:hypothetical protein
MSGYRGQPPSDWQGPYGQDPYGQQPYGRDPYGQDPYGPQPAWQDPYAQQQHAQQQHAQQYAQHHGQAGQDVYGGMYGPPGIPQQSPSNAAAVAAIIGNCIGLVFICGIGIAWLPGLILGGMAVNKIRSDPAAARSLTMYSWVCCGLNFVIEAVIFTAVYIANH